MADFNQILTPGDVDAGIINVVNEIPAGSCHKIEWNHKVAAFQLDRVTDPVPEETVTLSPVTVTGTQQQKANSVTFKKSRNSLKAQLTQLKTISSQLSRC